MSGSRRNGPASLAPATRDVGRNAREEIRRGQEKPRRCTVVAGSAPRWVSGSRWNGPASSAPVTPDVGRKTTEEIGRGKEKPRELQKKNKLGVYSEVKKERKNTHGSNPETTTSDGCHLPEEEAPKQPPGYGEERAPGTGLGVSSPPLPPACWVISGKGTSFPSQFPRLEVQIMFFKHIFTVTPLVQANLYLEVWFLNGDDEGLEPCQVRLSHPGPKERVSWA